MMRGSKSKICLFECFRYDEYLQEKEMYSKLNQYQFQEKDSEVTDLGESETAIGRGGSLIHKIVQIARSTKQEQRSQKKYQRKA